MHAAPNELPQREAVEESTVEEDNSPAVKKSSQSLRSSVERSMKRYLKELDGQIPTDVYQMVLAEVEEPLLRAVMNYTSNNQTKASIMLGLNRGTLRTKLKQYKLI